MKLKVRKGQDSERHCQGQCVERQPTMGQLKRQVEKASDTTASRVVGDPVQREGRTHRARHLPHQWYEVFRTGAGCCHTAEQPLRTWCHGCCDMLPGFPIRAETCTHQLLGVLAAHGPWPIPPWKLPLSEKSCLASGSLLPTFSPHPITGNLDT